MQEVGGSIPPGSTTSIIRPIEATWEKFGFRASPSSRGLGHHPFTVATGVRIPVGTPIETQNAPVLAGAFCLTRSLSRSGFFQGCVREKTWRMQRTRVEFRLQHRGAIAQLGERLHGMQEVGGSIPPGSTTSIIRPIEATWEKFGFRASPSSRGLGHHPFTVATGVRIPVGTPLINEYRGPARRVFLFTAPCGLRMWSSTNVNTQVY